jgi:hypothetical protein
LTQENLTQALLSPAAIAEAIDTLRSFCSSVERDANSRELRNAATEQLRLLGGLAAAADHFFLYEQRDPLIDWPPEAEILRQPTGNAGDLSDRPVFILGCRRSGTTLLSHVLNAGSEISALPENYLVSTIVECKALFDRGVELKQRMQEPFPRFLRRLGQFADSIYLTHAACHGKKRWASKELAAWRKLDVIDAMFDYRARFVYVIRHGLDVAWSCATRFPMRDGLPSTDRTGLAVAAYLNEWIANNEATLDFVERNSERSCIIRYEEFTEKPESRARHLYDFVQQPWDDGVFSRMEKQRFARLAGDNKYFKSRGKVLAAAAPVWRDWPAALVKQLGRQANPTLIRLGYDAIPL